MFYLTKTRVAVESMISLLFTRYFYGNKIKENEMVGHVVCIGEMRDA
jgi:hypothetical protein